MNTKNCFPSIQVSTRRSRSPLWFCFYHADVGHPPRRDPKPSPARRFLCPWLFSFATASQTHRGEEALHLLTGAVTEAWEAARQGSKQQDECSRYGLCGAGAPVQPPAAPAGRFGITVRISDPTPSSMFTRAVCSVPDHCSYNTELFSQTEKIADYLGKRGGILFHAQKRS